MSSMPPYQEGGNWYNSPTQASQPGPGYVPPTPAPMPGYMQPAPVPMPVYVQPAPTPVYMVQPQYMAVPVIPLIQAPDPGAGQAVAGMVLGILSLPFSFAFFGFFGILPLLGLIFSIIGLRSTTRKGMAIAGLILSTLCLLIAFFYFVFFVLLLSH